MHQLIEKLFLKRGIKDTSDLDPDEKRDFENWQKILSKEKLTIEDIGEFCQSQIEVIKAKWTDLNLDQVKKSEFIPYFTVYSLLLQIMESPQKARANLEIQLQNLINS